MLNTIVVAPAHVGIDIVTFFLALLLHGLAAELTRGYVVTQALFSGKRGVRNDDAGQNNETQDDSCTHWGCGGEIMARQREEREGR